jgi:uncharacterized protein (TIGR02611 family)
LPVVDRFKGLMGVVVRSTRRLAVLVIGCAVTAAGLVMMVTPGPGLVVIVAGLAILATEFTWAEILLERAKRQALRAKDAAVRRGAGLLRRRRTVIVEVVDLPVHGPPAPHGHVELVAVTVVDRVDRVDRPDQVERVELLDRSEQPERPDRVDQVEMAD